MKTLAILPRGTGVIFRHYGAPDRQALAKAVAQICRRRGLVLAVAGDARFAQTVGAAGLHLPEGLARHGLRSRFAWWRGFLTISAHSLAAVHAAKRHGAHGVVLSPVLPTDSHPNAPTLGPVRFAALCRQRFAAIIALGGLNGQSLRRLKGGAVAGVATVGGLSLFTRRGHPLFLPKQTRK